MEAATFFYSVGLTNRGGSRNSLKGGGGSGPEFFEGGGAVLGQNSSKGLGSRSVEIFIY